MDKNRKNTRNTRVTNNSGMTIKFNDAVKPEPKTRRDYERKYDVSEKGLARHRKYRREHGDKKYFSREFIAYDGEGISLDDGSHLYTLFASSRGLQLQDDEGIGTNDIFESLLDAKRRFPNAIHVIYGGSYDFNMWLTDVSLRRMEQLYDRGTCLWGAYKITWRRGKSLRITDRVKNETIIVYDVVSFFQRPFVQACDEYLTNDEYWQSVRDMIIDNKKSRGTFTTDDNDKVADYNHAELVLLVNLMSELRDRLGKVSLRPSRWDGPGAIATALLQREQIKRNMASVPDRVAEGGRYAYFGGRFELLKAGDVGS